MIYSNYYNFVPTKGTKTLPRETFPGLNQNIPEMCLRPEICPGTSLGSSQRSPDPLAGLGEGREEKEGRERRGRVGSEGKNPQTKSLATALLGEEAKLMLLLANCSRLLIDKL